MRVLKFTVNGQFIQRDASCDFENIAPGSKGYLVAQFAFDSEWDGCTIAAAFWRGSKEYAAHVVNGRCKIPAEALAGAIVGVSVTGERGDFRITTNKTQFYQGG